MKLSPSCAYRRIEECSFSQGLVITWLSKDLDDPNWDCFLQQTPLGQFQQSSMWARAKSAEGWLPVRVLFTRDHAMLGGFQLLKRSSWWRASWWGALWWGAIGYVSKGPVVLPEAAWLTAHAVETLKSVASRERLLALVVQPPDMGEQISSPLIFQDFMPNALTRVNQATWTNDIEGPFEQIEKRMNQTSRNHIRRARRNNVVVREGGQADLGAFFQLMLSTCRRQGVHPNPPTEEALAALWNAARPKGSIRLTMAERDGGPLAGLLSLLFGQRVTAWKKGWTTSDGHLFANDLINHEILQWANANGYQMVDFAALDVEIAIRMCRGEELAPEQRLGRDVFNMRFGGKPSLLPESMVYIPNRAARLAYRTVLRKKISEAAELDARASEARKFATSISQ